MNRSLLKLIIDVAEKRTSEPLTNTCCTHQLSISIQDVFGFEEFYIGWQSP
jgi:hypothetical protein